MKDLYSNISPQKVNGFQDYDLNSDKENISNISSIKFITHFLKFKIH